MPLSYRVCLFNFFEEGLLPLLKVQNKLHQQQGFCSNCDPRVVLCNVSELIPTDGGQMDFITRSETYYFAEGLLRQH